MVILSRRLQIIADKITEGSRLADIGSDHALLPTYLAQQGRIRFAVAGEVNLGPFKAANLQVNQLHLNHVIDVRSGDGLSVIQPYEVDVISIAGMGGNLITQILSEGLTKLIGVKQLVLQPNVGEEAVRRWLFEHDWVLIEEEIILEDHKIYEILNAVKSDDSALSKQSNYIVEKELSQCSSYITPDRLFQMGPHLIRKPSSILIQKWEREIQKLEKICESLSCSTLESSQEKLQSFRQEIFEIKEVLNCLQKVKP